MYELDQKDIICPNCLARLLIPTDNSKVICKFCGNEINLKIAKNSKEIEKINNPVELNKQDNFREVQKTDHTISLLFKARNQLQKRINDFDFVQTDKTEWIYDFIPPEDPNYGEALLAQSFITCINPRDLNLKNAWELLQLGLKKGVPDKNQKDQLLDLISGITSTVVDSDLNGIENVASIIKSRPKTGLNIADSLLDRSLAGSLVLAGLEGRQNQKFIKIATELFERHNTPYCFDILSAIWIAKPDKETAENIETTLKSLLSSQYIHYKTIQPLIERFKLLQSEVRKMFPPEKSVAKREGKNGCGCFIATATMQTADHPYVVKLKKYRDLVLMKSFAGRKFISFYYKHSPLFANLITQYPFLQKASLIFIVRPAYFFVIQKLHKKNLYD